MNAEQYMTEGINAKGPCSISSHKRQEQADIELQIAEYLAKGGEIKHIEGPTLKTYAEVLDMNLKFSRTTQFKS